MQKPAALITGAGRGIGRGIAEKLAELDYNIVIDDIFNEKEVMETLDSVKAKGAEVLYVQADISISGDRQRIVQAVKDKFNRLDVLVNNAGVAPRVRLDILEATEESFDRVLNINLKGPYFLTQLFAARMIMWKSAGKVHTPRIAFITSISAYTSSPYRGEYCVSKAGLSMAVKLFADRLAEYSIPVLEVQPGIIETPMTSVVKDKYDKLIAEGLLPLKRWGQPEDVARVISTFARGDLDYSTGECIEVGGGFGIRRL